MLPDRLLNRPFGVLLRTFDLDDVVPGGLGVPDETPDELPIERVDIDPFDDVDVIGCVKKKHFLSVVLNNKKIQPIS